VNGADGGADQALDVAKVRSARWTVLELDPKLLAAPLERAWSEIRGIVEMQESGRPKTGCEVSLDRPARHSLAVLHDGSPCRPKSLKVVRVKCRSRVSPRRYVDLQGQRWPPDRSPEMLIDDDDIDQRVVHLYDLKRVLACMIDDGSEAVCCGFGASRAFCQAFRSTAATRAATVCVLARRRFIQARRMTPVVRWWALGRVKLLYFGSIRRRPPAPGGERPWGNPSCWSTNELVTGFRGIGEQFKFADRLRPSFRPAFSIAARVRAAGSGERTNEPARAHKLCAIL
jgi:hypothetical protein